MPPNNFEWYLQTNYTPKQNQWTYNTRKQIPETILNDTFKQIITPNK